MGGKYEVLSWCPDNPALGKFGDESRYMGNSLLRAVLVMVREKRRGVKCVTLRWR